MFFLFILNYLLISTEEEDAVCGRDPLSYFRKFVVSYCRDVQWHKGERGKEMIIYKKKYRSDLITHAISATQLEPKS